VFYFREKEESREDQNIGINPLPKEDFTRQGLSVAKIKRSDCQVIEAGEVTLGKRGLRERKKGQKRRPELILKRGPTN